MDVITRCDDARHKIWSIRASGRRVGFVPTMGALHDGHLSLVRMSGKACDATVASIFVNPTQFGPGEDLQKYPRTFEQDCKVLEQEGVAFVFAPTIDEIYPEGFSTFVDPPSVAEPLEGICRPGHFRGVTTVVMKLLQAVPATHAFFGSKDYQQLKVVEAMCHDLGVGIEIIAGETVRESDGLALSSRNRYLSSDDRIRALALSQSLRVAADGCASGELEVATLEKRMFDTLIAGVDKIDYASIVDAQSLSPLSRLDRPSVALIAAYVGKTRLIDNCLLDPPS